MNVRPLIPSLIRELKPSRIRDIPVMSIYCTARSRPRVNLHIVIMGFCCAHNENRLVLEEILLDDVKMGKHRMLIARYILSANDLGWRSV